MTNYFDEMMSKILNSKSKSSTEEALEKYERKKQTRAFEEREKELQKEMDGIKQAKELIEKHGKETVKAYYELSLHTNEETAKSITSAIDIATTSLYEQMQSEIDKLKRRLDKLEK